MAALRSGIQPSSRTRWLIGLFVAAVVLAPLVATFEYTLRSDDGHSWEHWAALFDGSKAATYRPIWVGLMNSLMLMATTVVLVLTLLAPTMILVNLRFPRLRRPFEFVALLPVSIPAIVLVVGLAPIYLVIGRSLGTGAWTLAFAYGITVLPFAFRSIQASIDAVNLTTLAEAARSLGGGWTSVVVRVLLPNLRSGLLAASLISVAAVLGEYTIASLLNRQNLQTALVLVSRQDAYVSVIISLLALIFGFVLLLLIGGGGRTGQRKEIR